MDKHIPIVGWLHIAHGAILMIVGVFVFLLLTGAGLASGDRPAILAVGVLSIFMLSLFVLFGLPHVIGGIALLNHKSWARTLVIVMSFFALAGFPIGTAIGIYSLWVLFNDDIKKAFATA